MGSAAGENSLRSFWEQPEKAKLEVGDRSVDLNPTRLLTHCVKELLCTQQGLKPKEKETGEEKQSLHNGLLRATLTCRDSVFLSIQWAHWAK